MEKRSLEEKVKISNLNSTLDHGRCPKRYFLYVFLTAFCFRLILLFALPWEDHIIDSYDDIAVHMLEGIGFSYNGADPTVCRAPAYPAYLAMIFYIFGYQPEPFMILRLFDIALDSITSVIVLWLSVLWFPKNNRFYKLAAGLAYALNPFVAYYTLKLGAETLYILFFSIHLGLLYKAFFQNKNKLMWVILFGVGGGILLLNKSIFLPLTILIPILLLALFSQLRTKSFALRALSAMAVSLLILMPWTIRNMRVADRFVPVQTLTGNIFWYDFVLDENRNRYFIAGELDRETTEVGFIQLNDARIYYPYSLGAKEDAKYDKELIDKAIRWIAGNPHKFVLKIADNIVSFWYFVETPRKMIITAMFSLLFILLSVRGAAINSSLSSKTESLFFLILVVMIDLIHSPVIGVFRHSLLTYPLLSLLSGVAIFSFLKRIMGRWAQVP